MTGPRRCRECKRQVCRSRSPWDITVAAGLAISLALTSFMGAMFYQVEPSDPLTYAAVVVLLVCAALFASYMPARRASGVEVTSALRCE